MCSCNGAGKVYSSPFLGAWIIEPCSCEVVSAERRKQSKEWMDFEKRFKESEMRFGGINHEQRVS
ncbi:hypothetical protein QUF99_19330 [Bacillus sp. DX4.1]|uniref:hypothetical protein n=1 Tax=Bacillus sp. DX4.1 TaxID=3055867 RepID=UPI0025A2D902|nr:hypothetical protein [Bacillus sp. DX4.1]MDM5189380.1 hypothetical protein [Bacillus sp. DX4.1]